MCGFVMSRCSCVVLGFFVLFQANGYFDEYSDNYLCEYVDDYSGSYFGAYADESSDDYSNECSDNYSKMHSESDEKSSSKSDFEGLCVGLGASCDYFRSRVSMDDNLSQLARFRYNPGYYERGEGYYYEPDSHGLPLLSTNKYRFGGNVSLGYGAFFSDNSWFTDNCYLGIEVVADVASALSLNSENIVVNNRNNPQGEIDFGKCSVRYEGIAPTVALRFGGYIQAIDSLTFLRLGCRYLRYKMDFEFFPNQTVKSSVFTPIIGLGIEKNVGHGFALKAEIDCSLRSDKTHNVYGGNFRNGPDKDYRAEVKHRIRGYTARFMGVYHF